MQVEVEVLAEIEVMPYQPSDSFDVRSPVVFHGGVLPIVWVPTTVSSLCVLRYCTYCVLFAFYRPMLSDVFTFEIKRRVRRSAVQLKHLSPDTCILGASKLKAKTNHPRL